MDLLYEAELADTQNQARNRFIAHVMCGVGIIFALALDKGLSSEPHVGGPTIHESHVPMQQIQGILRNNKQTNNNNNNIGNNYTLYLLIIFATRREGCLRSTRCKRLSLW